MSRSSLGTEQVLTLLAAAPQRIAAVAAGAKPVQLQTAPAHDEWSANEVLAHLRACADVWGDCILAIIAQDKPTLRAINPRTWIKRTNYLEQRFEDSLRAYTAQRIDLLDALKPLTSDDWSRSATITGAGAPLERTVLFYAQWIARHERPHVKQIERIVQTLQTR